MKAQDIICVTMTTWEGDYMKTIVHMMKQLSKKHRVLFVDYPFTYKDVAFAFAGKSNAPVKRILGIDERLRKLDKNLYHLTLPAILPTNWIENANTFKQMVAHETVGIAKSIREAAANLQFVQPLVINAFNPIIGLSMIGKLNESANIYYCYDEIRAAEWCGKHGGEMEDAFIPQMDAVITTSANLHTTKSRQNTNTHLVRNGVDFRLFNLATDPWRFEKQTKTIGYVGSIDFRLDYDLLEEVIKYFPQHQFKFVGRITDSKGHDRLNRYSNVSFTGGLQPKEIPGAMRDFDLGLIPFSKNEFTRNVYPLKINEYLAAGIPVVSTDFSDLTDFAENISIAPSAPSFIEAISGELSSDSWEKSLSRFEIARNNDWSARAQEVEEIIDSLYMPVHA